MRRAPSRSAACEVASLATCGGSRESPAATRPPRLGCASASRGRLVAAALAFLSASSARADVLDSRLVVPPPRVCSAVGAVFTDPAFHDPSSPDWTGYLYPTNLIYKEWMRIGGPNSPIGCPISQVFTDPNGYHVQFEHGQVAVAPSVWEQGVLAAYQDGNNIIVDWTVSWDDPSHFNYTKFLVRWDYNGQHYDTGKPCERGDGDQCDVLADMGEVQAILLHYFEDTHLRTKGTFTLQPNHGNGLYTINVEGCDEGAVGGSTCRQGWFNAVSVLFTKIEDLDVVDYPIDLTRVPSAHDTDSSRAAFFQRAGAITLYNACRLLPHTVYRHEESYMTMLLAKLDFLTYYQSDQCPGRKGPSLREEAFASLARQEVGSRVGTTNDSCPGCRTGEYDVALSGYVPIVLRFGEVLPASVRDHIVNDLLDKRGPLDLGDHSVIVGIPESENHTNMIESARYLTNDILFARTGDSQYDNASNGVWIAPVSIEAEQWPPGTSLGDPPFWLTMRDYWLRRLHHMLQTDFIEYNARPYQGYSMRALQNLYSWARDPDVRTAAGMVLDYVSAKLAASSNEVRRAVPYRRKAEYNAPQLIGFRADPQSARMIALVGDLDLLPRRDGGAHGPWYGQDDMQMAIASAYRIPDPILDSIINPNHRLFFQGIHHYADEQYASSPSVLLSAGGHYATYAYTFLGTGKGDDIGMALPTTVMPTGFFKWRTDLLRFEGSPIDQKRSNMCVAPGFACGIEPVVPPTMTGLAAGCVVVQGSWTFINFTGPCRIPSDTSPYGFYAAAFQRVDLILDADVLPPQLAPLRTGLVEVFDTRVNSNVAFQEFAARVLANNPRADKDIRPFTGASTLGPPRTNLYVTVTGQEISFELAPDSRIISIANGPPAVQSVTDFATGSLLRSPGMSGVVTITNPWLGQQLTLDDSQPDHPVRTSSAVRRFAGDECLSGFVWRLATTTDHVCVTAAQRTTTQTENQLAAAHTFPDGTCKANYTWRLATPNDHVCVAPTSAAQARWDNELLPSRLAAPLP